MTCGIALTAFPPALRCRTCAVSGFISLHLIRMTTTPVVGTNTAPADCRQVETMQFLFENIHVLPTRG